jgi:hypothetical protein
MRPHPDAQCRRLLRSQRDRHRGARSRLIDVRVRKCLVDYLMGPFQRRMSKPFCRSIE